MSYTWTDDVAEVDTDVDITKLHDNLMHLKYDMGGGGGFRQGVLSAPSTPITAGTGLSVNVAAGIVLTVANGYSSLGQEINRVGVTTSTTVSGLTDNATNLLYADIAEDGTLTLGKTTTVDLYQSTFSTTNGQFVFDPVSMTGKVGNGSTSVQAYRVFFGDAVASGGSVTSVSLRAIRGRYQSADFPCPSSVTITTLNHNIGCTPNIFKAVGVCQTAEYGYSIDEVAELVAYYNTGAYVVTFPTVSLTSRNVMTFTNGYSGSGGLLTIEKDAGQVGKSVIITAANWKIRVYAWRGW